MDAYAELKAWLTGMVAQLTSIAADWLPTSSKISLIYVAVGSAVPLFFVMLSRDWSAMFWTSFFTLCVLFLCAVHPIGATEAMIFTAALFLAFTMLVQRQANRALGDDVQLLKLAIDDLRNRIIALEVAERRRRGDALRTPDPAKNVLEMFTSRPAASGPSPPTART